MAAANQVGPPNSLLLYFQSKVKAESTATGGRVGDEADNLATENGDGKKRKNKNRESLSMNQAKKMKFSQSSDDDFENVEASSGRIKPAKVDVTNDDSVCEVSYVDFMLADDNPDIVALDLNQNCNGKLGNGVHPHPGSEQTPHRSIKAFFGPKTSRTCVRREDAMPEKEDVHVEIVAVTTTKVSNLKEKLRKHTQKTISSLGTLTKLAEQDKKLDASLEVTSSEEVIVVGSDIEEQFESKNRMKKKIGRKASQSIPLPGNDVNRKCNDVTGSLTRPKRTMLDVMAEARKKKAEVDKPKAETRVNPHIEVRKKKFKSTETDLTASETMVSGVSTSGRPKRRRLSIVVMDLCEPERSPRERKSRVARRKSSPSKSPDGSDLAYKSEFVDPNKTILRVTRLRTRQLSGDATEKTKTAQIAQQLLNKAKSRDGQKKKGYICVKSDTRKSGGKDGRKTSGRDLMMATPKSGGVAAIFQTKKKPTKAELKAKEEELTRRREFLQGGIPQELRLHVAQSIQVMDSISQYLPLPVAGTSHTGYQASAPAPCGNVSVRTRQVPECRPPSRLLALGELTAAKAISPAVTLQFQGKAKYSHDVIKSVLTEMESDHVGFPVCKMYQSLHQRKQNEAVKRENETECSKSQEVIILTDVDEIKNGSKKKKSKKKKLSSIDKKPDDVIITTDDVGTNNGDVALVDVYNPTSGSDVVGNNQVRKRLTSWLTEWREKVDRDERQMKRLLEQSCKRKPACEDEDDFQTSGDESSSGSSLGNTVLLTGAMGRGKTSLVYALAQDLGYKVLEVSACNKRSGKIVMSQLQEATQSQHVSNVSNNSPSNNDKTNVFFAPVKAAKPVRVSDLANSSRHSSCLSLILFDEVDIVYEEDKGFWQAIENFIKTTKKPMIMTSNDRNFKFHFESPVEEILFTTPKLSHISCYLRLVCLAEGFVVKKEDILNLVTSFDGDIRKCLNAIHFWAQCGGSRQISLVHVPRMKEKVMGIPVEKQEGLFCRQGKSDEDVQSKRKSIERILGEKDTCGDVYSSAMSLGQGFVQYLLGHSTEIVHVHELSDWSLCLDLLHANMRRILPLPKLKLRQAYPMFHKQRQRKPAKRTKIDAVFDDDVSRDEAMSSGNEENTRQEVEDVTSRDATKALDLLSRMTDTMSLTDAILSESRDPSSRHVTSLPGLDDRLDSSLNNKLLNEKGELRFYSEYLNMKLGSLKLHNLGNVQPIPVENDVISDDVIRLRHDFDLTSKSRYELNRCLNDVEQQLGPSVTMDTTAVATDYVAALRCIVKAENLKQTSKNKRRFFHYLDNISVQLSPSSLETLSTSF